MKIRLNTLIVMTTILSLVHGFAEESTPRADLDYRSIRREATGREHAQVKTPRGTIFYKVKIQRIDDYRVTITHQDGLSTLEYSSIPEDWIKEFNIIERTKRRYSSPRSTQSSIPEFDLSGMVSISGDSQGGIGFLVKSGEAYYVYTDCAIISGNKDLSFQAKNGKLLQVAQVIQCAEGVPLVRIQVKLSENEIKTIALADVGSGKNIQAHQYIYPLKKKDGNRAMKVSSVEGNTIETSSRFSKDDRGMAIVMASHKAIGLVLGKLPENQRLESNDHRFESHNVQLVRLDINYKWKTVRLKDYLLAKQTIIAFDKQTKLYKAISECRLSGGKIFLPSDIESISKINVKNRDINALVKLSNTLDKKTMKVNANEVQRKLKSIIDSALRTAKKEMAATNHNSFSWYHRYFIKESLDRRKRLLTQTER